MQYVQDIKYIFSELLEAIILPLGLVIIAMTIVTAISMAKRTSEGSYKGSATTINPNVEKKEVKVVLYKDRCEYCGSKKSFDKHGICQNCYAAK